MSPSLAALVPMKAHSERVPNKNIRPFNGRPLFQWILSTLRAVSAVDKIVVDTDSEKISTEARDLFDVRILDRPERLRGDDVPMNDILLHDVTQVDTKHFLQTHCTNPLLRPETVRDAIETYLQTEDADSLFSVTPVQTRLWNEDKEPINHERDRLLPTQELPPVYEENSNLYIFTQASLETRQNRIGNDPMMFEMRPEEAVDIDEPLDFRVAEFLHRDRYGSEPSLNAVISDES